LVTLFVMVQVLLRPYSGPGGRSHSPLVTTIVLFIVFAGGSWVFHEHFARKERRLAAARASGTGISPGDQNEPGNLAAPSIGD
jgi:hypothetical protein